MDLKPEANSRELKKEEMIENENGQIQSKMLKSIENQVIFDHFRSNLIYF